MYSKLIKGLVKQTQLRKFNSKHHHKISKLSDINHRRLPTTYTRLNGNNFNCLSYKSFVTRYKMYYLILTLISYSAITSLTMR